MTIKITVDADNNAESPLDYDGWKLHSFARNKFVTDVPMERYCKGPNKTGDPIPATSKLRHQLKIGTAFWVSCYQHSGIQWGLMGEVQQCQWDTARVAGVLIWEDDPKELKGMNYERLQQSARATLDEYNKYCNGETLFFSIENEDGDFIYSCGVIYDTKEMIEDIKRIIQTHNLEKEPITLHGDAKYVIDIEDFTNEQK